MKGDLVLGDEVIKRKDIIDSIMNRWVEAGLYHDDIDYARHKLEQQDTEILLEVFLDTLVYSVFPCATSFVSVLPENVQN